MKRKLLFLTILVFVTSFIGCEEHNTFRITGLQSIDFYEQRTYSHDTWHGHPFVISVAFDVKEINPLYTSLKSLSPIGQCRAMASLEPVYTNHPDLSTTTLTIDKELVGDGRHFAAGDNIIALADEVVMQQNTILVLFEKNNHKIEITDGEVTLTFGCTFGTEQKTVSTRLNIDLVQ